MLRRSGKYCSIRFVQIVGWLLEERIFKATTNVQQALGCEEEVVLSKDIVVEFEAANAFDGIDIPSQVPVCVQNHNRIDFPRILSLLPLKLGRPRFIAVWHISDIFPFKLAVRNVKEGRLLGGSGVSRGRTFGGFTSVKRGVDEVRREREEGRTTCDINVDHATNSGVLKEQCTWICGSGMFL